MKIGERIKRYEQVSKYALLPRGYVFVRVDGKAFHTFTRNMARPYDNNLIEAMVTTGERCAKEMMGFKLGYHQSDEFSFLLTDLDSYETQIWFDGEIQKITSVAASMFTAYFNDIMGGTCAMFDARAFNVPTEDVPNVFLWRQQDWERNSLQMLCQTYFSQKQLHGKGKEEMHEMLFSVGANWANLPDYQKNGTFITKSGERVSDKMDYTSIQQLLMGQNKIEETE